jgi:hypothetical protein
MRKDARAARCGPPSRSAFLSDSEDAQCATRPRRVRPRAGKASGSGGAASASGADVQGRRWCERGAGARAPGAWVSASEPTRRPVRGRTREAAASRRLPPRSEAEWGVREAALRATTGGQSGSEALERTGNAAEAGGPGAGRAVFRVGKPAQPTRARHTASGGEGRSPHSPRVGLARRSEAAGERRWPAPKQERDESEQRPASWRASVGRKAIQFLGEGAWTAKN